MANSGAIDAAVVQFLRSDTALAVLCPDGVWWQVARQGARKFVIVALVESHDEDEFGDRAYEENTYMIKAVEPGTTGEGATAAAARIDALFEFRFPIEGFHLLKARRDGSRIHEDEVDDVDRSIRWQHRGAHYVVQAQSTTGIEPPPPSWIQSGFLQP